MFIPHTTIRLGMYGATGPNSFATLKYYLFSASYQTVLQTDKSMFALAKSVSSYAIGCRLELSTLLK